MRLDLLSLKLFVTVCEQQSISRTAEIENIAASAVSKRISDLEKVVKSPLFHRGPRGTEMTPAAHSLLHHARIVLSDINQLESELSDHSDGLHGIVRLHASFSMILQRFPQDLSQFLQQNPSVRVDLSESTSPDCIRAVLDNVADVGVFGGITSVGGLQLWPYRSERLCALMPAGHPLSQRESVSFAEMAEYDLVAPQVGSFLDSLVMRAEAELNRTLRRRVRTNGYETASRLVEAGLGIALVPEDCARRYVQSPGVVAVGFNEKWAKRYFRLCVRNGERSMLVDHLVRHLSTAESRDADSA